MPSDTENNNDISINQENNKGNAQPAEVDVEEGKPVTVVRESATGGRRRVPVRRVLCRVLVMFAFAALLGGLVAVLWYFLGWIFAVEFLVVAAVTYFLAVGGWRWLYVALRTAPRDIKAIWGYIKLLTHVRRLNKNSMTLPDMFDEVAAKHPNKPCFLFQDEVWTYAQVQEYSFKIAQVFKSHGYTSGQCVGLLMNNCAQYPATWLGLARLGVITPLINTNQRSRTLLHSLNVANCDALIYGEEFEDAVQEIYGQVSSTLSLYRWRSKPKDDTIESDPVKELASLIASAPATAPPPLPNKSYHGKVLYIYTSGTTGLPKAALITHSRFMFMAGGIHFLSCIRNNDILYTSLPLYHTAGCITAVGQAIIYGNTVAIRNKFSASNFFKDCIKYKATVANYIGEMCRYLLATPESEVDKNHKVRLMYGNGLRPQIWTQFTDRFNIKLITEFYGATEGNANIVNIDGKPGAIGFVSRIMPFVYPIALIKVDEFSGEPIRNAKGLCQTCKPNEPGVFVGKIQPSNPTRAFLGYVDKSASEKKVITDVFSYGDSAFISGDILVADELGYLYFKDRTGDTFRWRGENVSTSEVEGAVSQIAGHKDAVVYGVLVPNVEGRAGMCGIVDPTGKIDLDALLQGLKKDLPPYARPIFIRVLKEVDMTGTFKMKKTVLQQEGFDPNVVKDKLYYLDSKLGKYTLLDKEAYDRIISGQIRL